MATSNLRFRIIGDDDASGAFLRVAAAAKLLNASLDDVGSNALGLTKLFGGAGLVPVIAGATAAVSELGTAMAAGGLAAGVFGLSVGGIFADMLKAQKAIGVTETSLAKLTKGSAEYKEKLQELHAQQSAFNKEFGPAAKGYTDMGAAFTKFKASTSGVTKGVLHDAFEGVAKVLPKLVPVSNAAGRAVGGLVKELVGWTKGPGFKGLLDWLRSSGPKAITAFGHSIGHTISGIAGIFKNFVGPGDKAAATLEKLTARFDKWGHSKGVSDSVNKFLAYVSGNGPQISSVFASLAEAAPKLASAMGQLGSANLTGISMFLNLIAGLPQGAFDAIVKTVFAMAVAIKAVRLATSLWAIAQGALNLALTANPIGLIVVAIAALVAGLVIAYKKSETFRAIVNGAFHGVAVAAGAVFNFIKNHWKLLAAILGGPFVAAAILIMSNWGRIKAGAQNVVGAIKGAFSKVKAYITAGFQAAVGVISGVFTRIINAAKNYVSFYASIPGKIKSAVGNLATLLYQAGRDVVQGLINGIQSMAGDLLSKASGLAHSVSGAFKGALGIHSPSRVFQQHGIDIMRGLVNGIDRGFVSVKTVMEKVTGYIQAQGSKLKSLMSARGSFAQGFQSFTTSLFGADYGTDASGNSVSPDVNGILAYQQQQASQAAQLRANVRSLVKLGLSPALLKQLQSAGPAGAAQIAALAHASRGQIKQLNASQHATSSALNQAGMAAGNAIWGQQIVQTRNNIDLAKRIAHELKAMDHHGKGEYVVVKVEGHEIIRAIRKTERTKGQKSTS